MTNAERIRFARRWAPWLAAGVVLLAMLSWPIGSAMLLGWAGFLARVVPRLSPDRITVIAALVALALFTIGVHWLGRSWASRRAGQNEIRWTWRVSLAVTMLIFVLFAAGVAMVGL